MADRQKRPRDDVEEEKSTEEPGAHKDKQTGDLLSASSYQEQVEKNNGGDEGRDEDMQAADFLRGSRGDEPPSALLPRPGRHDNGDEKMSTAQNELEVAAGTEKPVENVEIAEEPAWQLGGDAAESGDLAATTNVKDGAEKEPPFRLLPHQEVSQPGQFTDMDAVAEVVTVAD